MKKTFLLCAAFFIIAGSILAACSNKSVDALTGDWRLVSYGSTSNPTPTSPAVETSLTFGKDGTVGGSVGCNSFGGDYTASNGTISFESLASTEMACEEPLMQQESAVFQLFANSAAYKIEGNLLTITSSDGANAVVFARR